MKKIITSFALFSSSIALVNGQATDITVGEKTLVQRCLIEGPSSRMIAVGNPGGFNYAFDALHCTPVYAWTGGFIDFKGEVKGRGGNKCKILGKKQSLGTDKVAFRRNEADSVPTTVKFNGYRRDSGSGKPTFSFEIDGLAVEQSVELTSPDVVKLSFNFAMPSESKSYYRIDFSKLNKVELGEGLVKGSDNAVEIPAGAKSAEIVLHLKPIGEAFEREIVKLSGKKIYEMNCNACHSLDGGKLIGPTFKGILGKKNLVTRDGKEQEITVDTAYLTESIIKPQAAIVRGYEAVPMPSFEAALSKDEIERLVKYISGL